MAYRILLVDDHKLFREGLKSILERRQEFQVAGEADSGPEAVQLCREIQPDLVLMTMDLPGMDGIAATAEIVRYSAESRVVILSRYDDEASVMRAVSAGARAFMLRTASTEDLLDVLKAVGKGGLYLCPEVAGHLQARIHKSDLEAGTVRSALEELSPRELQVLRLVAVGKTSKQIAALLDIGLQTVRSYRKTMMKKLGVNNIAGLTHLALANGLTRLPPGHDKY